MYNIRKTIETEMSDLFSSSSSSSCFSFSLLHFIYYIFLFLSATLSCSYIYNTLSLYIYRLYIISYICCALCTARWWAVCAVNVFALPSGSLHQLRNISRIRAIRKRFCAQNIIHDIVRWAATTEYIYLYMYRWATCSPVLSTYIAYRSNSY